MNRTIKNTIHQMRGNRKVHINRERRNDLVFYAKNHEDIPRKLRDILEPLLFDERIELYRSLASLKQRFCLPSEKRIIAIIFATDKEDLLDIISMKFFSPTCKLSSYFRVEGRISSPSGMD